MKAGVTLALQLCVPFRTLGFSNQSLNSRSIKSLTSCDGEPGVTLDRSKSPENSAPERDSFSLADHSAGPRSAVCCSDGSPLLCSSTVSREMLLSGLTDSSARTALYRGFLFLAPLIASTERLGNSAARPLLMNLTPAARSLSSALASRTRSSLSQRGLNLAGTHWAW